ncbi:MAG: 3-isopropylmalate dehydratase small subunit [Anaerolineales bacterium]|jgi:3-isopropylmalate/(R)-2-methylmalate dehydratase small subunit
MQPFKSLTSKVIPLPLNNIDTDQIIPARYLKVTDKNGLVEGLFSGWRYLASGQPDPGFPLNDEKYQDAQILIAGDNFGCGSSREHAPWALVGWGLRAVISTSFADIFQNNALKNGLLTVAVDTEIHSRMMENIERDPELQVTIDLPSQQLRLPDGSSFNFPIDPFSKTCLIEGVDQMGYLLMRSDKIEIFEQVNGL